MAPPFITAPLIALPVQLGLLLAAPQSPAALLVPSSLTISLNSALSGLPYVPGLTVLSTSTLTLVTSLTSYEAASSPWNGMAGMAPPSSRRDLNPS